MDDLRTIYTEAAAVAADLLGQQDVAGQWHEPSVLGGLSVGELAAHLARSVLQVESFLDGPVGEGDLVTAIQYYARLVATSSPPRRVRRTAGQR